MKKAHRVKKGTEIEAIIKTRQSVGNSYFVLYKKKNHEQDHFRFALSVPKKYGIAVKRNKIKRQIRDIVSKLDIAPQVDLFLVVKPKANELSFVDIKNNVEQLVRKQDIMR